MLRGLKAMVDEGKIRHWGVSNETTFGLCELVKAADKLGMTRPVTIQNNCRLLNRSFEGELAEACAKSNCNIGLLPWGVLGGGVLSGKYSLDETGGLIKEGNENARFVMFSHFQSRFWVKTAMQSVEKYKQLAKANGMSVATLAQAWCATRWFIPSTIIAAITMKQLEKNIDAFSVHLNDETLAKIDEIHVERMEPFVNL